MAAQISLTATIKSFQESGGHTLYQINVIDSSADGKQYTSAHRFSEFLSLHTALLDDLGRHGLPAVFPVAKSVFGGDQLKHERVAKLNEYMSVLLGCATAAGPSVPRVLCAFLAVQMSGCATMRRAQQTKEGDPSQPGVLEIVETTQPEPGPGQVLIKVRSVSINPVDYKLANGSFPNKSTFPRGIGTGSPDQYSPRLNNTAAYTIHHPTQLP